MIKNESLNIFETLKLMYKLIDDNVYNSEIFKISINTPEYEIWKDEKIKILLNHVCPNSDSGIGKSAESIEHLIKKYISFYLFYEEEFMYWFKNQLGENQTEYMKWKSGKLPEKYYNYEIIYLSRNSDMYQAKIAFINQNYNPNKLI